MKPVCPTEPAGKKGAAIVAYPDVMSQPSARVPAARRVNSVTAESEMMRVPLYSPPLSIICAKTARSATVLNKPA